MRPAPSPTAPGPDAASPDAAAVEVRHISATRGRGLVTCRPVARGDLLLAEPPLAAVPCADPDGSHGPACAQCLRSLEGPLDNVRRVLAAVGVAAPAALPGPEAAACAPAPVRCGGRCRERYCGEACRRAAWQQHHRVACPGPRAEAGGPEAGPGAGEAEASRGPAPPGPPPDAGVPLLEGLRALGWEAEGMDYGDAVALAVRVVLCAVARRRGGCRSVAEALGPFGRLVAVHWDELSTDSPLAAYDASPPPSAGAPVCTLRDVARATARTPDEAPRPPTGARGRLVAQTLALLRPALACGADERPLLSPQFWGYLLGTVLVNAQSVAPQSPFALHLRRLPAPGGPETLVEALLPRNRRHVLPVLRQSVQGLGLYPTHSAMNHSCRPNAEVTLEGDTADVSVRALRPLAAGEEVTIAYIQVEADRELRHWQLRSYYGFTCTCDRCSQGL